MGSEATLKPSGRVCLLLGFGGLAGPPDRQDSSPRSVVSAEWIILPSHGEGSRREYYATDIYSWDICRHAIPRARVFSFLISTSLAALHDNRLAASHSIPEDSRIVTVSREGES